MERRGPNGCGIAIMPNMRGKRCENIHLSVGQKLTLSQSGEGRLTACNQDEEG